MQKKKEMELTASEGNKEAEEKEGGVVVWSLRLTWHGDMRGENSGQVFSVRFSKWHLRGHLENRCTALWIYCKC